MADTKEKEEVKESARKRLIWSLTSALHHRGNDVLKGIEFPETEKPYKLRTHMARRDTEEILEGLSDETLVAIAEAAEAAVTKKDAFELSERSTSAHAQGKRYKTPAGYDEVLEAAAELREELGLDADAPSPKGKADSDEDDSEDASREKSREASQEESSEES